MKSMVDVESTAQCAAMCNEDDRCMAWSYEKNNNCYLKNAMPLHAYKAEVTSGEPWAGVALRLHNRLVLS